MTRLILTAIGTAVLSSLAAAQDRKADDESIRQFTIAVKDEVLADLKDRLRRTRWPDEIGGTGWDMGVPLATMKDLVGYWQTGYDWRKEEKKLNELPQFMTRIDGLDIHFVHVRSREKHALPLVVVLFFLLSAALPRWTVPPRYDVLLRTRAYDQIGPMISVDVVVQEYPVFDCRVIE